MVHLVMDVKSDILISGECMKTQEISVQLEASPGILIYEDWRLQKRKLDSNLYYVHDGEKIS